MSWRRSFSALQTEVLGIRTRLVETETRNESLQEAIVNLVHENELLKRRLYAPRPSGCGRAGISWRSTICWLTRNSCKNS
jgi:hypothetical protein